MFLLPISGHAITLRAPGGCDELSLAEAADVDLSTAVAVIGSAASKRDHAMAPWPELPLADLHAVLLALRRLLEGDRLVSEALCTACAEKVDLSFSITEYLEAHAPKRVRGVIASVEPGWFDYGSAAFRVVSVADAIAASRSPDAVSFLRAACVRSTDAKGFRRAESAMRAIAPLLSGELAGRCPECRAEVAVWFDPVSFVLSEMRHRAAGVYRDVHLLASAYGWSELHILHLPRSRRERYVEIVESAGGID